MAHYALMIRLIHWLRGEDFGLTPDAKRARVVRRSCATPPLRSAFFLAIGVLVFAGCSASAGNDKLARVVLGGRTFLLEIAADEPARIQGLSDRASIAEDGGMIFVFPDADQRDFVMRRCPIPIDILFIDPTGRIVQMYAMKPEPPETTEEHLHRYSSDWPAQFAIELRGGTLAHLELATGQKVELPVDDLKSRAR